jgi:hypothetical protein
MTVNDDRRARPGSKPKAVADGNPRNERDAEREEGTRQFLARLIGITFSIIAVVVVIGGLAGRFDQTLVDAMITALSSAAAGVVLYFFHHDRPGGGDR